MTTRQILYCQEQPGLIVDAADFDGTNDFMTRGATLTGAADSKTGILSAWVRFDGHDGVGDGILGSATTVGGTTPRFYVNRMATNKIQISAFNAAASQILILNSVNAFVASATWRHILASWDMATVGARSVYMGDVDETDVATFTNDTIDYTVADWAVGAIANGSLKMLGPVAELYFAPGQYLDFSIVANRRKFISASGKPVFLGVDGSAPTGTPPIVYQHLADGESVANFATNRGTGGDFTITGTLDTASSSPSD